MHLSPEALSCHDSDLHNSKNDILQTPPPSRPTDAASRSSPSFPSFQRPGRWQDNCRKLLYTSVNSISFSITFPLSWAHFGWLFKTFFPLVWLIGKSGNRSAKGHNPGPAREINYPCLWKLMDEISLEARDKRLSGIAWCLMAVLSGARCCRWRKMPVECGVSQRRQGGPVVLMSWWTCGWSSIVDLPTKIKALSSAVNAPTHPQCKLVAWLLTTIERSRDAMVAARLWPRVRAISKILFSLRKRFV